MDAFGRSPLGSCFEEGREVELSIWFCEGAAVSNPPRFEREPETVISLDMELIKRFVIEELKSCKEAPKQSYNHKNYQLEELLLDMDDDFEDEGGDWVRIRRSALDRLWKLLHPPPPPTK